MYGISMETSFWRKNIWTIPPLFTDRLEMGLVKEPLSLYPPEGAWIEQEYN